MPYVRRTTGFQKWSDLEKPRTGVLSFINGAHPCMAHHTSEKWGKNVECRNLFGSLQWK